jgi:hypothetical protein
MSGGGCSPGFTQYAIIIMLHLTLTHIIVGGADHVTCRSCVLNPALMHTPVRPVALGLPVGDHRVDCDLQGRGEC